MLVAKVSMKELKEREKEQRRDYIVDAADKLFLSKGYDSVSMNDIADAVGMNKATLYLYFKSKESLFFSVVQRGVRLMEAQFREATAKEQTGLGKVRAIGETFIAFSHKNPDHYRMFIYSSSDRFDWDCCAEARSCHELMHMITGIMCESIETGMKDGTIRKDMDPLEIAIFLMTATQNIVNLSQGFQADLAGRGFSYQQYVEHSMSLLGQAIEGREGAAVPINYPKSTRK